MASAWLASTRDVVGSLCAVETMAPVLASQAEAIVRTAKHGHKLLNGGTKHSVMVLQN